MDAQRSCKGFLYALDKSVEEYRLVNGKKPLPKVLKEPASQENKQSTSDADSGYMVRDSKPKGFFYLDHCTVDGKHNLITDVHVTPGNVHDSIPYLERLDMQKKQFNFNVEAVGLGACRT